MFDIKGFYVSASGAIHVHHGPLVKESNSLKNSKEDQDRNIYVIFHQNRLSSFGEKIFKEKVNARTDARRTTDHDISSLAFVGTIMGCTIMFKDAFI